MNAHTEPKPADALLTPAKVADYMLRLEAKTGRRVECLTILPGGGIEVRMAGGSVAPVNPADFVDMSE